MLQSHIVDIDGTFVGAAVRTPEGYKFVAVDGRMLALDGRVAPTLAELRHLARAAFFTARVAPPAAGSMAAPRT